MTRSLMQMVSLEVKMLSSVVLESFGCFRQGSLEACTDVCNEVYVGILCKNETCENETMQVSIVMLEKFAKGRILIIKGISAMMKQWSISSSGSLSTRHLISVPVCAYSIVVVLHLGVLGMAL